MPSDEEREFDEATALYARLAGELVTCRKTGPMDEYERKLTEWMEARERCTKARQALNALMIRQRTHSSE